MKVLVVQPLLPKYVIEFFNSIVKNTDVELRVLADTETSAPLNQAQDSQIGFKVCVSKYLKFGPFVFHKKLLSHLLEKRNDYDLVVLTANPRDLSSFLAAVYLKILGKKFYTWSHFLKVGRPSFFTNLYFYLMASLSTKCLCYSRSGAINLKNLGVGKEKIRILGTAIDETKAYKFHDVHINQLDEIRDRYGLNGKKIVLQVVRLSKVKKPELILRAAEELCLNRGKNIAFILIGDGELRSDLEVEIVKRDLTNHVITLGAIYDEEILAKWFKLSSLFIVPTAIGLSLHHAMSYGAIVLTDDSLDSQMPEFELLVDGLNGFTYAEDDVISLIEKIEYVLDNEEKMNFISKNAEHTVHAINSLKQKTKNFLRIAREA